MYVMEPCWDKQKILQQTPTYHQYPAIPLWMDLCAETCDASVLWQPRYIMNRFVRTVTGGHAEVNRKGQIDSCWLTLLEMDIWHIQKFAVHFFSINYSVMIVTSLVNGIRGRPYGPPSDFYRHYICTWKHTQARARRGNKDRERIIELLGCELERKCVGNPTFLFFLSQWTRNIFEHAVHSGRETSKQIDYRLS